jgi:hypothetical protein
MTCRFLDKIVARKKTHARLLALTGHPVPSFEDETDMLSIYGKAMFRTLRDTNRGVPGCPSIDKGRGSLPYAKDHRVQGNQPIR